CFRRPSLLFWCIEFNLHSKERGERFPRFLGCPAVNIRALGLFGQTLDFCDREHLARFLREFRSDWLWLTRTECVYFVSVKPDKVAVLADIHVNFRSGG